MASDLPPNPPWPSEYWVSCMSWVVNSRADFSHAEDHSVEQVPGTGLLSDQGIVHGHEVKIDEAKDLKRGTGKYAHVVLIPQPSDDPRDP